MWHHLDKFISSGIDWFWRKRSPGVIVLGLIVPVLIVLLSASWALSVIIPSADGAFQFSIDTTQGPPKYLIVFGIVITVVFVALGSYLLIGEQRRANKKRVVVMELRGLRDTTGNPLMDKVPDKIIGQRQQILVNIRRSDGKILDPDEALQQVTHLPISVANLEIGVDRADITYVAGGARSCSIQLLDGCAIR